MFVANKPITYETYKPLICYIIKDYDIYKLSYCFIKIVTSASFKSILTYTVSIFCPQLTNGVRYFIVNVNIIYYWTLIKDS